ncbi:copper chaperone [Rufibacter hautae]|uniref:Copper chaperone n=1 Tax=Rufibacter hautae TaxID=2595005 RepID=A0A5B6TE11_9BACT|nr:copper chaperone [Rufibacter hautae]KAA3438707.1 copper chaperone [Rufibacter hautae]
MELLKFKTNIGQEEEIGKVAPYLDGVTEVSKWKVDTNTGENILSVSGDNLDPQKVKNAVAEAGFSAELLRVLGIGGDEL